MLAFCVFNSQNLTGSNSGQREAASVTNTKKTPSRVLNARTGVLHRSATSGFWYQAKEMGPIIWMFNGIRNRLPNLMKAMSAALDAKAKV